MSRTNDAYAFTGYASVDRGYAVNGLNQYSAASGGVSYGYDTNGNLTQSITPQGSVAYGYDAENRLVTASSGVELRYDPLGRLWQVSGSGVATTQFLYDGDQLSAEYDGSGALLRRYVHSTGDDDPMIWYEGSGVTNPRYLYANHQGSVVAIVDGTGNRVGVNGYDEYGIPSPGNIGRFQYTGQAWIPELGLYHYKARMYSPTLGRFLQTDPIGYEAGLHLYLYVRNDPINRIDPTGMQDWSAYYQGWGEIARQDSKRLDEFSMEMDRKSGAFELGLTVLPIQKFAAHAAQLISRQVRVYRALYVTTNLKTGLTVFETRSIAAFFGKKVEGAQAAMSRLRESGFRLPKGVTVESLKKYRVVAERAIDAGKTPEVQRARIQVIDEVLKSYKQQQ